MSKQQVKPNPVLDEIGDVLDRNDIDEMRVWLLVLTLALRCLSQDNVAIQTEVVTGALKTVGDIVDDEIKGAQNAKI